MSEEELPPAPPKDYESKKWFCTVPNPAPMTGQAFVDRLIAMGATKVLVSLERAPTTGTLHFQGAFEFPTKKRRSALNKIVPGRYERQKTKHAYEYCAKADTHVDGPWIHGVPIPRTIPTGLEGHEPYMWQQELFNMTANSCVDTRKIYWYYSAAGATGKSSAINYLTDRPDGVRIRMDSYREMACAIAAAIAPEMVGAKTEARDMKVCVIDCPRDCRIDYSIFEGLKDGFVWNSKYRPGGIRFAPCWVIVFANVAPCVDEATLSQDRLIVRCLD